MAVVNRLDIQTAAGIKTNEVIDYEWMVCSFGVNKPGYLRFKLRGNHRAIPSILKNCQIDLWRKDDEYNIGWYRHFNAIYREPNWTIEGKTNFLEANCIGIKGKLLGWRHILYPSGTVDQCNFTAKPAETIMKRLVDYNCCANSTVANGRIRAGAFSGFTVEADGGQGNAKDWNCFADNVLESLQGLALIGGGDFDIEKSGDASWIFKFFPGQLGTDRSNSVIFAVERQNMGDPTYKQKNSTERTIAVVGGKGNESARTFVTRTGAGYSATNDIETFVNGSMDDTTDALNATGDKTLKQAEGKDEFDFTVLQTKACMYGKHYFLGDLVNVYNPFTGVGFKQKIDTVTIRVKENGEQVIDVETATP